MGHPSALAVLCWGLPTLEAPRGVAAVVAAVPADAAAEGVAVVAAAMAVAVGAAVAVAKAANGLALHQCGQMPSSAK